MMNKKAGLIVSLIASICLILLFSISALVSDSNVNLPDENTSELTVTVETTVGVNSDKTENFTEEVTENTTKEMTVETTKTSSAIEILENKQESNQVAEKITTEKQANSTTSILTLKKEIKGVLYA